MERSVGPKVKVDTGVDRKGQTPFERIYVDLVKDIPEIIFVGVDRTTPQQVIVVYDEPDHELNELLSNPGETNNLPEHRIIDAEATAIKATGGDIKQLVRPYNLCHWEPWKQAKLLSLPESSQPHFDILLDRRTPTPIS